MAPIHDTVIYTLHKRATVAEQLTPTDEQKVTLYVLLGYGEWRDLHYTLQQGEANASSLFAVIFITIAWNLWGIKHILYPWKLWTVAMVSEGRSSCATQRGR